MAVRVCRSEDLVEGGLWSATLKGVHVALARHRGRVQAFSAICPHQRHDLSEGFIAEDGITCGSHLWHFEFGSGRCTMIPEASIPIYPASEEDGWVLVELPR